MNTRADMPYSERCPRCQMIVVTRVQYSTGTCWWVIFILGVLVICWPMLFFLCCNISKDVSHFCPNCGTLIAVNRRGC
ncbi:unnamed protein product [Caenorhabditis angaria]|uniref:LITAF domain-containing protein n=1 Tax=Caenorhabditis angaria TaxID=860376 RepID=A0A9P1ILT3_9PELO|nr:unnamed protein product [Caenorhabditis angaria]